MKRFCVVGTGSMGARHIKNLAEIFDQKCEQVEIDVLRSSMGPLNSILSGQIHKELYSVEEMQGTYDAIIIANPTSEHYNSLLELKDKSGAFFIEKPVFDKISYNTETFNGRLIYVAAPLRYTGLFGAVKEITQKERVLFARAICSSFLPEWRPGTDYSRGYSARKELGGGVEMDLIHEWDYLIELFGYPDKVHSIIARESSLDIDTNDIADYIAQYPDLIINLHLDYFGRVNRRELELFLEDDTVVVDFIKGEIRWLSDSHSISYKEERDDYQKKELEYFLNLVSRKETESSNNLRKALKTLQIAKGEF
jgi:predicted dehydrogenase